MSLKDYYKLAKPGMVYGNMIPLLGGFALATRGDMRPGLLAATVVGSALGMASGCVFNNYIDHDMDAKMKRTQHRAVAAGRISRRSAFIYGSVLGLAGTAVYALGVNFTAWALGAVGFFFYVVMYSMWFKRRSVWGTVVGGVAGAMPPVVGYVAGSGKIDLAATVLFTLMMAWQMPHFFAIAIRHADDYRAAGVPALPLVRGLRAAKAQIVLYVLAFVVSAPLLWVFGYAGMAYLYTVLVLGFGWLALSLKGYRMSDAVKAANELWARDMFVGSLVVLTGLFAVMTVGSTLRW